MNVESIAALLGGSAVLGSQVESELDLVAAARRGISPYAVDLLIGHHLITADDAHRLIASRRTLTLRRLRGQPLSARESDRLVRIARVLVQALDVFGDPAMAARWLRKPCRGIAGAVPMTLLATEAGARLVERSLGRLAHSVYA